MPLPLRTLLLATLLAGGLLLARAQPCAACSCAWEPEPPGGWTREQLIAGYDVVFRGHVIDTGALTDLGGGLTDGHDVVRVHVDELWKGELGTTVLVDAGSGGGDCTIPFAVGDAWLIYGYPSVEHEGIIATNSCSRSIRLGTIWGDTQRTADIPALGPGERRMPAELLAPGNLLWRAQAILWGVTQPLSGAALPWGWWTRHAASGG